MITILGHTVDTKKEAAILLRAIIKQAEEARELLDDADTTQDVVIDVPSVQVDQMTLATVDGQGAKDAWAEQVARNEAERAAQMDRRVEVEAAQMKQQESNTFALKVALAQVLVDLGKATPKEVEDWAVANAPKDVKADKA